MIKSPFSYESIRDVYDRENRKGKIDLSMLPAEYCEVIHDIHEKREELRKYKKISKKKMDKDAKASHDELIYNIQNDLKRLYDLKDLLLSNMLLSIEKRINDKAYEYKIKRDEAYYLKTGKESFHTKGYDLESMIMSKLLCRDLASAFKVKTSNRHHIMACIKGLLVADKSFIIVRTDIKHFFESIPHELILSKIRANTFVSSKTVGCIRSVLAQYDVIKSEGGSGIGLPRGIAMSSYLSEIIMSDFDKSIRKLPNVIFYSRYVDDVFILLSHLNHHKSPDEFFSEISSSISKNGLNIHPQGSDKSLIINYDPEITISYKLEYLGYRIQINPKEISYHLSDKRYSRILRRLDNAFDHFELHYRRNPRKARRDLIDSLNLLSGNTCLHQSKQGVKTGLYYSNDLISKNCKQLVSIQQYYLHNKVDRISLDPRPFGNQELCDAYCRRLKHQLGKISFPDRWKDKKMFSFSIKRLKELSNILGE